MHKKLWLALTLVLMGTTVSGCAALVIGAAGAVVADEAVEQKNGGDGLF